VRHELDPISGGFDFDGVFYGAMAGGPIIDPPYAHVPPWCFRILTPALVRALPWNTLASFRAVAFASTVALLRLVFAVLADLGFDDRWCAINA
jgi:hypothetical protein